jgi:hypothetical protein
MAILVWSDTAVEGERQVISVSPRRNGFLEDFNQDWRRWTAGERFAAAVLAALAGLSVASMVLLGGA